MIRLGRAQKAILPRLGDCADGFTTADLEGLPFAPRTISNALRRLGDAGLARIARERDPQDPHSRQVWVITPAGREALEEAS